jgi:hypothetical protein
MSKGRFIAGDVDYGASVPASDALLSDDRRRSVWRFSAWRETIGPISRIEVREQVRRAGDIQDSAPALLGSEAIKRRGEGPAADRGIRAAQSSRRQTSGCNFLRVQYIDFPVDGWPAQKAFQLATPPHADDLRERLHVRHVAGWIFFPARCFTQLQRAR